jgi:hypothetical protein
MNTKSRGQSNQNEEKDKASRNAGERRKAIDRFARRNKKCFSNFTEREFTLQFSFFVRQTLRARCGCDN